MTKNWMWALVAGAMAGVVFGACGEGTGQDLTCTADTDCLEGEVCAGGVCAVTCTAGADCPDSAKTCETSTLAAEGTKVCQCATDALCNSEGATDLICQTEFKLCTPKCGTDTGYSCPTGFSCTAETGQCAPEAVTETCDPASTEVGANGGQDTCAYGEYCATAGCTEVTQGTCAMASGAPAWSSASTGNPVIFNVTAQRFATSSKMNPAECGDGGPKTEVTVNFYSATPLFNTTTFATWKSQVHVKFGGGFLNPAFEVSSFMPTAGAKVGTFKFGVCGPAANSGSGAVYVNLPGNTGAVSNTACFTY